MVYDVVERALWESIITPSRLLREREKGRKGGGTSDDEEAIAHCKRQGQLEGGAAFSGHRVFPQVTERVRVRNGVAGYGRYRTSNSLARTLLDRRVVTKGHDPCERDICRRKVS